jgi:acyl-CoA thioesterase FadM
VAGDVQIACVDRRTGRPTRLDADLRKQLEATLTAIEEVT